MEKLDDTFELRYRFQEVFAVAKEEILSKFILLKNQNNHNYLIKIVDHHVWMYLPKVQQYIYTPHLHLQIEEEDAHTTKIRALFGPHPVLWTLFMFLHFLVAIAFIFFGVIAYSNYVLKEPVGLWVNLMIAMVIFWFMLYGFARYLRKIGLSQAQALFEIYKKVVSS